MGLLSSVELLYLDQWETKKEEWIMGPNLHNSYGWTRMVEFEDTVILVGGSVNNVASSHLYQLSSPEGPWIKMNQTLKVEERICCRNSHDFRSFAT